VSDEALQYPPLPEPDEVVAALTEDGVIDIKVWQAKSMRAYAAPLLERLKALEAERDRWKQVADHNERVARGMAQIADNHRAERDQLAADAARLDFLDSLTRRTQYQNQRRPNESVSSDMHFAVGLDPVSLYLRDLCGNVVKAGRGENVRAAIDAARTASEKKA
jgi:hypothetical protein